MAKKNKKNNMTKNLVNTGIGAVVGLGAYYAMGYGTSKIEFLRRNKYIGPGVTAAAGLGLSALGLPTLGIPLAGAAGFYAANAMTAPQAVKPAESKPTQGPTMSAAAARARFAPAYRPLPSPVRAPVAVRAPVVRANNLNKVRV